MKTVFVLCMLCLLSIPTMMAQDETGFATSADVLVGYKQKTVSTSVGYDFGYKLIPNLYVGVGPMVSANFGNGESTFAGGGYGKIRFTAPLDFNIKPFVDGRVGYSYSFSHSDGNLLYGLGLGLRIADCFCLGIYCNWQNYTVSSTESYISGYEKRYNPIDKKYHQVPKYSKRDVKESKSELIPSLLLSFDF